MMRTLNKIKNFLNKKHPKTHYIYAITAGAYLGELLVYMGKENSEYNFLTLPEMSIKQIPVDKFDIGVSNNIVDVVEKLPSYVYETCEQQYKVCKSGNNLKKV